MAVPPPKTMLFVPLILPVIVPDLLFAIVIVLVPAVVFTPVFNTPLLELKLMFVVAVPLVAIS